MSAHRPAERHTPAVVCRSATSQRKRSPRGWLVAHWETGFLLASLVAFAAGGLAWLADRGALAEAIWVGGTVLGLVVSLAMVAVAVARRQATVDVIALLALAGALWVREPFAGTIVTAMLASGQWLEERAAARARRELRLLVERAPRTARRLDPVGVQVVPVEEVAVGDQLLVASGEIIPVDGRLLGPGAFDESALTGEPLPVDRPTGDDVRSGIVNAGSPVTIVATADSGGSTYAALVALVEQAQASSAPFVRVADRFALAFVPLTLVLAGAAWALTGDAVRTVAVLVVATPCPLLLAAPIAIMSGISRAARFGVIVKGGGALEQLGTGRVMLFDKTGTLTEGRPTVSSVLGVPGGPAPAEVLRLAASLDQVSPHVLASSIVTAATSRGLALELPTDVHEVHGVGLEGRVGGRLVRIGRAAWAVGEPLPAWVRQVRRRAALEDALSVHVSVDGEGIGAILLEDRVRPDAWRMVRTLRDVGIERVVLVTGDRADAGHSVGRLVGVDEVIADCSPEDKLAVITAESRTAPTIMVGDGVNDAPALAAAGVGVAVAARGATASSEAADVVLTVDRIDALADAVLIARRSKRIALQAVCVGMGLSLVAMVVAALGYLPPAAGAVLQEGIDLAAIGIALRGLLPTRLHTITLSPEDEALGRRLREDHDDTLVVVEVIRQVADGLSTLRPDLEPTRALLVRIDDELVPHERRDERLLVPFIARTIGQGDAMAVSRVHAEIERKVMRLHRLVDGIEGEATAEDVVELRRLLYGLYAVLRLHNAQEEEGAFSLMPD
ncbi:MAG: heavy metal translocating P-type ATPase [Intrasporangium sp.]|uniref:heavy metal translocating P-type ATPase n=1 Tax=Intrasporangium sp. TaxID=1925024 RepID=UPI0026492158|nr:heavy metal translocating P-type ATPase [Intrasporangium sp.]MDN5796222.1 heavy metal translocating P-type ATPase [Intrasporangium sp.]